MPSCYLLSIYSAWAPALFESTVMYFISCGRITTIILLNVTFAIFFSSTSSVIQIAYVLNVLTMSHRPFTFFYVPSSFLLFMSSLHIL